MYAEVNIKGKPSSRPRPSQPVKRDDDMVQYAAIDYQPKDAAEKSPPVVETKSKRMMLPDNPGTCVKCGYVKLHFKSDFVLYTNNASMNVCEYVIMQPQQQY